MKFFFKHHHDNYSEQDEVNYSQDVEAEGCSAKAAGSAVVTSILVA